MINNKNQTEMKTFYGNKIRETEKAINVELQYDYLESGRKLLWKAWIPKSLTTIEESGNETTSLFITIPTWLAKKIDTEIANFQGHPKMSDVDFLIHA